MCYERRRADGTREEPGTLTQGAPVFPGSSRLGIEPKTPGWLVQPNHQPIGGSDPNHQGIWSPPRAGLCFIGCVCLLLQDLLQSCGVCVE